MPFNSGIVAQAIFPLLAVEEIVSWIHQAALNGGNVNTFFGNLLTALQDPQMKFSASWNIQSELNFKTAITTDLSLIVPARFLTSTVGARTRGGLINEIAGLAVNAVTNDVLCQGVNAGGI